MGVRTPSSSRPSVSSPRSDCSARRAGRPLPGASRPPHSTLRRVRGDEMTLFRRLAVAAAAVSCFGVLIASANSALGTSAMPNPAFAGYEATDRAAITTFTGTVSAATLRCPARGPRNINAEVQLFDGPSSSDEAFFGWNAFCDNGKVVWSKGEATVEKYQGGGKFAQAQAAISATAGQTLSFTMTVSAAGMSGSVKNLASGASRTMSMPMAKEPSFKAIRVEMEFANPSSLKKGPSPIPSFTPVTFGKLRFDGATLASLSPIAYEMVYANTLEAVMGPISSAGTFKAFFKNV
jgi:hypothetical protein